MKAREIIVWQPLPVSTRVHNSLILIFSFVFAYVLQALPLDLFKDRENYLNYADYSLGLLAISVANGPIPTLANEPLWLLFNAALAAFFEPEIVVRSVIFLGGFFLSFFLLRANPLHSIWLMVFLLTPQLLKNHTVHLRQGLAMAIFYAGFFSGKPIRRWLLMGASPFIHASFFFVLPIVILPVVLAHWRFALDVRMLAVSGFAITASLALGIVAAMIGARQAGRYDFQMTAVSGLGFIFWAMIGGLFVLQGKTFLKSNQAAVGILIFYLISYFLIEVTARILESGLPLILLAGLSLAGWRRLAFIGAYLLYGAIQWAVNPTYLLAA